MKFGLNLTQRLEQILSPQLILNLKLLQLPALELETLVRQELEENPALEQVDESRDASDVQESPLPEVPRSDDDQTDGLRPGEEEKFGKVSSANEYGIEDLLPNDGYLPSIPRSRDTGGKTDAVELVPGPEPNLREVLLPHLRSVFSPDDARIAEVVIESLDEDGFLLVSEDELAASQGIELRRLREILYVIQRLEPGGIACQDQQKAFLVQLELMGYEPCSLESLLVSRYWKLLLQKRVKKIARLCGVSEEQIRKAIARILTLELKPARRFSGRLPEYISPDFSVKWRSRELAVEANDETFPRLRLSRRYIEILRSPKSFPKEQVKFAREKFKRAMMFLRGIESRRRTLRRLMDLIVDEQKEFFLKGPQYLKPATLRAAAERLGVHPSTASRATAGKYVETCYGVFSLKYFFKAGAGDKSRASIKQKIKRIIENEDKSKPLSDDEIRRILGKEEIKVARRTVAKYRNELGIPGRNHRGRF
ncbi:RNA polymerase sigma-54 factor [candidate division WOR-3 bacterium JGI_Cruoil_03_51_56]|uniref:RNA polymerase sigma-54 factor n=1 Tax=candidate division WOR-3 bacterium JGI_Cruoil_03_51_56 TaxID=1973747 RepID=A0A235BPC1_UNCW3|nr:MAG: RNA polymerase sigma-54 factor [candidate division WOR-3 bacterium JGI_Cruoil_03_51_56]